MVHLILRLIALPAILAIVAAACSSGDDESGAGDGESPASSGTPAPDSTEESDPNIPGTSGWETDWSMRSIDLDELRVGLPGRSDMRDGIRPIDEPVFDTVTEASEWITDSEPVILVEVNGIARAYPLGLLISHEIVNDEFGDTPVAVTYCPLCNSAVGFEREVDGEVLRFGVSGLLRNSDLVMWDGATTSLWQQITGEAIVGEFTGTRLTMIPTPIVSFGDFAETHPDGEVLSRDASFGSYGRNPYVSYDSSTRPFLFEGEVDDRYPAMERVVGVVVDGETKGFPFSALQERVVINDELAGVPIAAMWGAGDTVSALDAPVIAESQRVGTGIAYERTVGDQVLTFEAAGEDLFRDTETGTTWDLLGNAVDGPLAGERLTPAVQTNEFWFAWAAFNSDSKVCTGD